MSATKVTVDTTESQWFKVTVLVLAIVVIVICSYNVDVYRRLRSDPTSPISMEEANTLLIVNAIFIALAVVLFIWALWRLILSRQYREVLVTKAEAALTGTEFGYNPALVAERPISVERPTSILRPSPPTAREVGAAAPMYTKPTTTFAPEPTSVRPAVSFAPEPTKQPLGAGLTSAMGAPMSRPPGFGMTAAQGQPTGLATTHAATSTASLPTLQPIYSKPTI